jgi:alpha-glucosidase (family GH31 glycosyl hydrolase)
VAGGRVIRYQATLDRFPVFGREGHALPLGRAVQHTGEIDIERPLEQLWVFGAPTHSLDGFAQAKIEVVSGHAPVVHIAPGMRVERFGDATEYSVRSLDA